MVGATSSRAVAEQVGAFSMGDEAAGDDLGQAFGRGRCVLFDGDDRQHEAIFREMPAVADDDVFDDVVDASRNRCRRGPRCTLPALRAPWWSITRVSAGFQDESFLQAQMTEVLASRGVLRELPVLSMAGMKCGRTRLRISCSSSR